MLGRNLVFVEDCLFFLIVFQFFTVFHSPQHDERDWVHGGDPVLLVGFGLRLHVLPVLV